MTLRILFGFLLIFLIPVWVQSADEPVKATGEKIWGDNKKKITFIEGNVRIIQGSTVITTEKAEVDTDKKIAIFKDKVRLNHPDVTIEADNLEYDFKKKKGTFTENVILNRTEVQDEQGKIIKDAFQLTAAELYFETDTENFTAKSGGAVNHKDFSGAAGRIEYNDQKQELLFKGDAYLKRPGGEEITGEELKIKTQTKSFVVNNEVKLINEDVAIDGGMLEYDYQKKTGVFTDNVLLERSESKDKQGKITKEHFKLTTAGLFFESETKNFSTKSRGTVEHQDFTGSADRIEYNDSKEELSFKKNAYLKRPEGEEIKGNLIIIKIRDKSFVVNQNVSISFNVETEKEEEKPEKSRR